MKSNTRVGVSIIIMSLVTNLLLPLLARADCNPDPLSTGDTVTCDNTSVETDTQGTGSESNVTINVDIGSQITTNLSYQAIDVVDGTLNNNGNITQAIDSSAAVGTVYFHDGTNGVTINNNSSGQLIAENGVEVQEAIQVEGQTAGNIEINNAGLIQWGTVAGGGVEMNNATSGSIVLLQNNTGATYSVSNSGSIIAAASTSLDDVILAGINVFGSPAGIITNSGDINITNLDGIENVTAINVNSFTDTGTQTIINSGNINVANDASATLTVTATNHGMNAISVSGTNPTQNIVNINNTGSGIINVTNNATLADFSMTGISVNDVSAANIDNSNEINITNNAALTDSNITGISVTSVTTTDIDNNSNILMDNSSNVNSLTGISLSAGSLAASGGASGVVTNAAGATITANNTGNISQGGGLMTMSNMSNSELVNDGDLNIINQGVAAGLIGMLAQTSSGSIKNNSNITIDNSAGAGLVGGAGINQSANLGTTFHNSATGSISATGAGTFGFASILSGETAALATPNLVNDGLISADIGVIFLNSTLASGLTDPLQNYLQNGVNGTITGTGGIAISGNDEYGLFGGLSPDGEEHIENLGTINGNIELGDGDDIVDWRSGSINGDIIMGNSDVATPANHALNGNNLLNIYAGVTEDIDQELQGGDDTDVADGLIDILTFDGYNGTVTDGANIKNWETMTLDNAAFVTMNGAALETDTLNINNNSTLDLDAAMFALTATTALNIDSNSTLIGTGSGAGIYNISTSNLVNNGLITTVDNAVGDTINLTGNYSGSGVLEVDVDFGPAQASDMLIIDQDTTGSSTTLAINDITAEQSQATTGNGIAVIEVLGTTTDGDFSGSETSGQFQYDLVLESDNIWYLQSSLAAAIDIPQYSALISAGALAGHQMLSTMRERIGEIREISIKGVDQPHKYQAWVKGYHDKYDIDNHASGFESQTNSLSIGVDRRFHNDNDSESVLLLGASVSMLDNNMDLDNGANGEIDGLSGALYGVYHNHKHDLYVDAVLSLTDNDYHYENIAKSDEVDFDGRSYGASIEVGKRLKLTESLYLEPQARIAYQKIKTDGFTDSHGDVYDSASNESIRGSLGLRLERPIRNGSINFVPHIRAHIVEEFGNDHELESAQIVTSEAFDRTYEIGIGATLQANDHFTAYANAEYETSDFGGSKNGKHFEGLNFTIGLRFNF